MDRPILKSQKKQIFELTVLHGLNPSNFKLALEKSENGSLRVSCLNYKNSEYFFKFDFNSDDRYFVCYYSPGANRILEKSGWEESWTGIIGHVKKWLVALMREISTPDPWEEIEKYIPGAEVGLEDEEKNTPFTFEQVEHIEKSISRLKTEINKKYKFSDEQDKLIQSKLNYLIDRAKKIGRIDWKNIFMGTIITIMANLALNPQQAKSLWVLVKECFKGILLLSVK